jgi:site-specific DNA-methyltransferase (adenine-specific)
MQTIADKSVDLILCDLPYGTTDCKWDSVIPFDLLWAQYRRIAKPNAAIVLTAAQPFTSALVMSNAKEFKTAWVWNKKQSGGFATAKYHPLKITEDVLVFGQSTVRYFPQMRSGKLRVKGGSKKQNEIQSGLKANHTTFNDQYYPVNIIEEVNPRVGKLHPTQKPVALMEYLIRTYTNEGETVLDNCMGSGTTGVACANTGRKFIGIERDPSYFAIATNRIAGAQSLEAA